MSTIVATRTPVELARRIRYKAVLVDEHAANAITAAIECGHLLIEAKALVAHGEWYPWLQGNFPASAQTAQRWMKAAELERANPSRVRDLAIRDIYAPERQTAEPTAPLDPDAQRMLNAMRQTDDEPEIVDAIIILDPPHEFSTTQTRKWRDTIRLDDEARSLLADFDRLNPESRIDALNRAGIKLRQAAAVAHELAELLRRQALASQ